MSAYITTNDAIAYIGMNAAKLTVAETEYLDEVIEAVSHDIDDHCGRIFTQFGDQTTPAVFTYTAIDEEYIDLNPAVATVVSVDVDDGTGTFPINIADYTLLPGYNDGLAYTQMKSGALDWPLDDNAIRVTGVFGDPVPAGVKVACRIQVARIMARPKSPLGLASGFGEFGAMRVFGAGWDQDALARLAPFVDQAYGFA